MFANSLCGCCVLAGAMTATYAIPKIKKKTVLICCGQAPVKFELRLLHTWSVQMPMERMHLF